MPTLQQTIAEKFLVALATGEEFEPDKIEQIRKLLGSGKRPKADDFVNIFSLPAGGEVK